MTQELKPCPFCGGEARERRDGPYYLVYCSSARCYAEQSRERRHQATAAWNRRADLPPSLAEAAGVTEVKALIEAALERDGGAHDEDCRIHYNHRDMPTCNCGHVALHAAIRALSETDKGAG